MAAEDGGRDLVLANGGNNPAPIPLMRGTRERRGPREVLGAALVVTTASEARIGTAWRTAGASFGGGGWMAAKWGFT